MNLLSIAKLHPNCLTATIPFRVSRGERGPPRLLERIREIAVLLFALCERLHLFERLRSIVEEIFVPQIDTGTPENARHRRGDRPRALGLARREDRFLRRCTMPAAANPRG